MDAKIVGKRIRMLRQGLSLNQRIFSEKIGVNQSTLSAYENGNVLPSVDVLVSIAETFDVSMDWLCDISNSRFSISSVGDLGKLLFALDDFSNIRFELDITDKLPNDLESEDVRWCVSVKFYGNDQEHPENASICNMLASFAEYRREFEAYFINKEFFDMWKETILKRYSDAPLKKRVYEELSEKRRRELRDALLIEEAERNREGKQE